MMMMMMVISTQLAMAATATHVPYGITQCYLQLGMLSLISGVKKTTSVCIKVHARFYVDLRSQVN